MSSNEQVAKAFIEGRRAKSKNASTDGSTYLLFGHEIARKLDGEVEFDWCGYHTMSTRRHINEIIAAGKLGAYVSLTPARKENHTTFRRPAAWAKAGPTVTPLGHKFPRARYHRSDAWRGHSIPRLAVAGSSDTGMWSDSPAPSDKVEAEVTRFQNELAKLGIRSKVEFGETSNVFCGKRWVVVREEDFEHAAQFTMNWLDEHRFDTSFLHDADLGQLEYRVQKEAVTTM